MHQLRHKLCVCVYVCVGACVHFGGTDNMPERNAQLYATKNFNRKITDSGTKVRISTRVGQTTAYGPNAAP